MIDLLKPRCPVCDWPLKETMLDGCVEGSCSYRPEEGSAEYYRIARRREVLKNTDLPPST